MTHTTLGDLVCALYNEFLLVYGDSQIAEVATAATVNDLIVEEYEETIRSREVAADAA